MSRQRGDDAGRAEVLGGDDGVASGLGPSPEEMRRSDIETNFRFDLPS
jgi:hypothetical protein